MRQEKSQTGSLKSFIEWNYLKLKNYTRKQLGDRVNREQVTEEILHDVATDLLTNFSLESAVRNMAAYIYRSIRNRVIDLNKAKRQEYPVSSFTNDEGDDLFVYMPDGAWTDAVMEGLDNEGPVDLEAALSQLSPEEQELIIENEFNGRTFAELSAKWGISQGTLLSRKHRAMQKLHKILKNNNKN